LIQQSFLRNEWITQFWIYSDRLATFGAWLQQLWAESLAKSQTRQGAKAPRVSTPMACVGAVDQHSILQQVAEGERDKLILFFDIVGEKDQVVPNLFPELKHLDGNGLQSVLEAESQATLQALSQAGVSNLRLELDGLTAASLAACFMLFELVIGTLGEGFDINAFDQPGVENGKVLAKQLLMK
jgi:glucose-6-phosphate isomerase